MRGATGELAPHHSHPGAKQSSVQAMVEDCSGFWMRPLLRSPPPLFGPYVYPPLPIVPAVPGNAVFNHTFPPPPPKCPPPHRRNVAKTVTQPALSGRRQVWEISLEVAFAETFYLRAFFISQHNARQKEPALWCLDHALKDPLLTQPPSLELSTPIWDSDQDGAQVRGCPRNIRWLAYCLTLGKAQGWPITPTMVRPVPKRPTTSYVANADFPLAKPRFEGGSWFFLGGGSLNESPTFPPVRTQKTHSRCGLAPRFGCLRCESTFRTGNVATFTLQGLLRPQGGNSPRKSPHKNLDFWLENFHRNLSTSGPPHTNLK